MLKLKHVFSDGAVFQENVVTELHGIADPGARLCAVLYLGDKEICRSEARADRSGLFSLPIEGQSGSYNIYKVEVSSGNEIKTIENIQFGQVWLASGQSNMEMNNFAMENADEEYDRLRSLPIRFFTLDHREKLDEKKYYGEEYPLEPVFSLEGSWHSVSERVAYNSASAVACRVSGMIAEKYISDGREMPVAFLNLSIGGSTVENWLPAEICEGELKDDLITVKHYSTDDEPSEFVKISPFQRQTVLYNTLIAPVAGMKCRGALWYQGESNCGPCEANETRAFFKKAMLIYQREYKRMFGIRGKDFPVICSLLYPWVYGDDSVTRMGYINMGMVEASAENPEIAVAPIYDLGATWSHYYFYHPIHPTNKDGVALRMGQIALARACGANGMPSAAYVRSANRHRDCIDLRFETFGASLWSPDEQISGFFISDASGNYVPARAVISSRRTVRVFSDRVKSPKHVCYQMADTQMDGNLYCGDLPVCPVATDSQNKLKVVLLPWTEPSVDSHFRRGPGDDLDFFMYPIRFPADGSAICYDPAYDAVRIIDTEKSGKCGMFVRSFPFLPLDMSPFAKMEFVCDCQPETEARVSFTYVRNGKTLVRAPKISKEIVGTTGTVRFTLPLLFRTTDKIEKIEFAFDLSGSRYPTVAVGRIELAPAKTGR